MTKVGIENAVEEQLKNYKEVLGRKEIAEILNISYQYLPKVLAKMNFPGLCEEGCWNHIKIHKLVMKEFLIQKYMKGGGKC